MKAKPKFIYFDLDDTLLDHKSAERGALADVYKYFDCFSDIRLDDLLSVYKEVNAKQWQLYSEGRVDRRQLQRNRFELTLQKLGMNGSHHSEIGPKYMEFYRNHWSWVAGAKEAFDKIRKKYAAGILTNGFSETQKAKFDRFGLYSRARHLVISEDVGYLKPHPKIFEHATELTSCAAGEILYIGDSYNSDVKGGTGFGWDVAWFTSNGEADKYKQADFVFNKFDDLCAYVGV